jgi:hypothetical protein
MSEHFPVLAENVSAMTPLDEATHVALSNYGVDAQSRQEYANKFSVFTTEQLDKIELAIALSRPQSLEPVVGLHDAISVPRSQRRFDLHELGVNDVSVDQETYHKEARDYELVKHNPARKLEKDSELVLNFLCGIGTTNPLRTEEGFDAIFELGKMRHLLENDYSAVAGLEGSDSEKPYRPELRLTEALVAEQMALIWTPSAVKSANAVSANYRELIANPNDVNVFSEEQADQLTDQQKWILIGAKQCYEAASLFEDIYKSDTASELVQQQALNRWIDMSIRGKLLERAIAEPQAKLKLQESVRKMTLAQERVAQQFIIHVANRRQAKIVNAQKAGNDHIPSDEEMELSGAAFEAVVIANERKKLIQQGIYDRIVRLSMPGEDQIERSIKPLVVHGSIKINLSSDVIIERLNGTRLEAFQAKAMPEDIYNRLEQRKAEKKVVTTEYPNELTKMKFTDSVGIK